MSTEDFFFDDAPTGPVYACSIRVGTGFGDNSALEAFVNEKIKSGKFEEKSGVMKPGVFAELEAGDYHETIEIDKLTVEAFKKILDDKKIPY